MSAFTPKYATIPVSLTKLVDGTQYFCVPDDDGLTFHPDEAAALEHVKTELRSCDTVALLRVEALFSRDIGMKKIAGD